MTESQSYHLLSLLLASEVLPNRVLPMGYAVTETPDNQPGVLAELAQLLKLSQIQKVGVLDPQSPQYNFGYPGPDYCMDTLSTLGVKQDEIQLVRSSVPLEKFNTFSEMQSLAEWVGMQKLDEILVVAPVFHLLRSYLSILSALTEQDLKEVRVYVRGVPMPLYEDVVHSQGIQKATRAELSLAEIEKCIKYTNLISAIEALNLHRSHRLHN